MSAHSPKFNLIFALLTTFFTLHFKFGTFFKNLLQQCLDKTRNNICFNGYNFIIC